MDEGDTAFIFESMSGLALLLLSLLGTTLEPIPTVLLLII